MPAFSVDLLRLDPVTTADRIAGVIRDQVLGVLRRRGVVVGLSGGVDSSVVAALCARAVGPDRVLGLLMPERHSSSESATLAHELARGLGIETVTEDITAALEGFGCYARQVAAIRLAVPDFEPHWPFKVTMPPVLAGERISVPFLAYQRPDGSSARARLGAEASRSLVAATNFKQRTRKTFEYFHADRLGYAVAGTPNRLEYDQGFFVKQGDGAADLKPIAHLYKTQVVQLAEHLGVPEQVWRRTPTTDTFPLPQTQEEFFFALPAFQLDLCLLAHNTGVPAAEAAAAVNLTVDQVERVFRDIAQKRRTTAYLQARPLLVEPVPEVA